MPNVPLVDPPQSGSSAPAIRANPGMFDAVGAAGARLGQAVSGLSEPLMAKADLNAKIKNATDTAYVIGAQTKLEAAGQDFRAWTLQNPDTSTWQKEFDARAAKAREDALSGAASLSQVAKLHLTAAVKNWDTRSVSELGLMQTQQNLKNAQGIAEEGVNQSIASNDAVGAHAIIDMAVKQGVLHPNVGAAMTKRVTVGIATNLANAAAEEDPFTAVDKLTAKDGEGKYTDFQGLPQANRETMIFRANKLANETRAQSVRDWGAQIAQAQDGVGLMPDYDGVRAEAERQGIPVKTIDRLFAPPKALDPHEFAQAYSAIVAYDVDKDPTHEQMAGLVAQIEGFKGDAKSRLNTLLTSRSDPKSELNTPVAKGVLDQMRMDREQNGTFIPEAFVTDKPEVTHLFTANEPATFKAVQYRGGLNDLRNELDGTATRSAMTAEEIEKRFGKGATRNSVLAAESVHYAQQVTKMTAWLDDHPKATAIEAEEYRQGLAAPYIMDSVKSALGAPAAAVRPNVTKDEYAALKPGGKYWWKGQELTKR